MKVGNRIHRVKSCPSTNDVAKDLALAGENEGTIIIAEEQTKGRGTRGRPWYSLAKKGLYASVILRPPSSLLYLLPLAAGLAVSDACWAALEIKVKLKWPNDLLWQRKKLGGILCETSLTGDRLSYAVLGLGININHSQEDFPPDIRGQATSLKLIKKKEIAMESLLASLWPCLDRWYHVILDGRKEKIINSFLKRSVFPLGKTLALLTDEGLIQGLFKGINCWGGLVLEVGGEEKVFFSGQINHINGK